jgi:hypothetical protein
MWKRSSVALCTAALTIMSIFLGAGTYAYTTGGSFIIDFSSPDTIKPMISGLSPGETVYIVIKIPNPHYASITANVRLLNIVCDENGVVEPEQEWYDLHGVRNDICAAITFGLWIDRDGDTGGCDTAAGDKWIIEEKIGSHIDDIAGKPISLGTIDAGNTITVVSSYHMDEETENWAQSDTMTFDIELTREEVPPEAPFGGVYYSVPPPPPPNEVVEEVPANQIGYVVDASDLAGTKVTLDTVAPVTVTILRYEVNPHPDDPLPATALPRYVDVSVSDPDAVVWPIYVEMTYTSAEVGSLDESSLGIYYWMDDAWHRCSNTGVDMERNIVWAYMTEEEASGSPILIGGTPPPPPPPPPPPKPAKFVLSGLIIVPKEGWIGKSIADFTISLLVTNVGDLEGSTTVDLLVNGVKEQSKSVTLVGGARTMVSFTVTKTTTGSYAVKVGDLTGRFTVMKPPTPAAFTFTGLVMSPADVTPGAEVTVSMTVKNTGEQSGTYSAELKLDGTTKETKTGTLAGGASTTVTFKVSSQTEGTHTVQVGTQTGSFTVTTPPTPPFPVSPGYIAGILIVIIAAAATIYAFRKGILPQIYPKRE